MKIILAGGGTGGHLFPGIALAETLKRLSGVEVLFLSTKRAFDRIQMEKLKLPFVPLFSPSSRDFLKNPFSSLIRPSKTFLKVIKIFLKFSPDLVVGLGGYGSLIPLLVANLLKIPYVLFEQNYIPGLVNRTFQRKARKIYTPWQTPSSYFNPTKVIPSAIPLRNSVKPINKEDAKKMLRLLPELFTLLIMGGSQGSSFINELMLSELNLLEKFKDRVQIIHLTGPSWESYVKQKYKPSNIRYFITGFFEEMGVIYSASDFVLSRAGGVVISELLSFELPSLLIPYPYATDNHQFFNAKFLYEKGVSILIKEKDLKKGMLYRFLAKILDNFEFLNSMKSKIASFRLPSAKDLFIRDIMNIAPRKIF